MKHLLVMSVLCSAVFFVNVEAVIAGGDKVVVIRLSDKKIVAGFAGANKPKVYLPAVVGNPKGSARGMVGMGKNSRSVIGHAAIKQKARLRLSYPIKNRTVVKMKDFRKIMHHLFYKKLRIQPEDVKVLILDSGDKPSREKVTRMLFETFNVKALYLMKRKMGWRKASEFASRSVFLEMFLTKSEYENMKDIKRIHKKFR